MRQEHLILLVRSCHPQNPSV